MWGLKVMHARNWAAMKLGDLTPFHLLWIVNCEIEGRINSNFEIVQRPEIPLTKSLIEVHFFIINIFSSKFPARIYNLKQKFHAKFLVWYKNSYSSHIFKS